MPGSSDECLLLLSMLTVPDPGQRLAFPEVGGSSHLSEHNQDKTPKVCPEGGLACDSRFCQVDNTNPPLHTLMAYNHRKMAELIL